MKIGLLGGYGQLGSEIRRAACTAGHTIDAPDSTAVNLTDAAAVAQWVQTTAADAWINCAAYTAVDAAEDNANLAYSINRDGAGNLAEALANNSSAPLAYMSTDYVFSGTRKNSGTPKNKAAPYTETDPTDPQSIYGASKLAGEQASQTYANTLVLRVSWVFGSTGHNFVRAILRAARRFDRDGGALTVVDDQYGAPCGAPSIANTLLALIEGRIKTKLEPGVYHFANAPHCNWYDFAEAIVEEALALGLLSKPIEVQRQPTSALNQKATRPPDGRMNADKLHAALGTVATPWRDDLRAVLTEWAKHGIAEFDAS